MGVEMPAEAKQMIDAAREGELPTPVKGPVGVPVLADGL